MPGNISRYINPIILFGKNTNRTPNIGSLKWKKFACGSDEPETGLVFYKKIC